MRVLVLGAGGFIGNAIAKAFSASGVDVYCASRTVRAPIQGEKQWFAIDRNDPPAVRSLLDANHFDIVVDMLAYTLPATMSLLATMQQNVGRYIMISSGDVYRAYGQIIRRETGPIETGLLAETARLRHNLYPYREKRRRRKQTDPNLWQDDYDKIPIEKYVRSSGLNHTILRLPMVFGPGDPQERFDWAIQPMIADRNIEAPSAWLDWVATYDHINNVAAAVCLASLHQGATNQTYNVASLAPVSHRVWVERMRSVMRWSGEVVDTDQGPPPLMHATRRIDLTVPLKISGAKLETELGFKPPLSEANVFSQRMR